MNLRWTSAGLAALADAANTGTAQLRLTHLAIGDGQGAGGAGDDGRAALRGERHRAVIRGTDATAGRIAFRADFAPDADYGITEAGVFGTAGDPPSKAALYLYWTDGGAKAGQAADGTALAIGATVDFQAAAADVAVTVGGKIEFGDPPDNATELKFGLTRYATAAETDGSSGERAVTPKGLRAKFGALLARLIGKQAADGTIYQLKGRSDGTLEIEERTQDAATSTALAGLRRSVQGNSAAIARKADPSDLPGDASATQKGIVELATGDEAKAGTDAERAVTPKALKAATDALSVPAAPATATTAKKGIVELATDAEAKSGTDAERAVTPKALKAAIAGKADSSDLPADASTSKKGIVELATDAEAKSGTDTARVVTPKGARAAVPPAIAALLASGSIENGKRYAFEGVTGGGLRLVRSNFLSKSGTIKWRERSWSIDEDEESGTYSESGALRELLSGGPSVTLGAGLWLLAGWSDDPTFPLGRSSTANLSGAAGVILTFNPDFTYEAAAKGGGRLPIGYDPAAKWEAGVVRLTADSTRTLTATVQSDTSSQRPDGRYDRFGQWASHSVTVQVLAVKLDGV